MARRSHFSNEPSDERGAPLSPQALTKQEFGRRLQKILDERNWTQADLSRAVEKVTGRGMGRDAVSTYINGRSFPSPTSIAQLCKALGMTRDELFPNGTINATSDEHPSFEMKAAAGHPGRAWVRVNRMLSFKAGAAIGQLISEDDRDAGE